MPPLAGWRGRATRPGLGKVPPHLLRSGVVEGQEVQGVVQLGAGDGAEVGGKGD